MGKPLLGSASLAEQGYKGKGGGSLARTAGTGLARESQPLGSTIVQWTAAEWAESAAGGGTSDGQGGWNGYGVGKQAKSEKKYIDKRFPD